MAAAEWVRWAGERSTLYLEKHRFDRVTNEQERLRNAAVIAELAKRKTELGDEFAAELVREQLQELSEDKFYAHGASELLALIHDQYGHVGDMRDFLRRLTYPEAKSLARIITMKAAGASGFEIDKDLDIAGRGGRVQALYDEYKGLRALLAAVEERRKQRRGQ